MYDASLVLAPEWGLYRDYMGDYKRASNGDAMSFGYSSCSSALSVRSLLLYEICSSLRLLLTMGYSGCRRSVRPGA